MSNKILILEKDDEEKEREFNIKYLLSLSVKDRYDIFFGMGEVSEELLKNGNKQKTSNKAPKIIKRK